MSSARKKPVLTQSGTVVASFGRQFMAELDDGASLFSACWNAPVPRVAVENPVMHKYAKARIVNYATPAQTVQPWWFGEEAFKQAVPPPPPMLWMFTAGELTPSV